VFSSSVGASRDSTARVVPAEGSRVPIGLTVAALCTASIWDVVIQLAFPVTNDKSLSTDGILLDITCQRHDDRRVCFMLAALWGCQPSWSLSLHQLWIVGRDTVRDLGYR